MTTLGAILTGGQSSRMGTDKTDVEIDGHTMLDRVAAVMGEVVDEVVLLGPDRPGYRCWPDAVHGNGPLAGIATALTRHAGTHVFVVAVDQPFVRQQTSERLIELAGRLPVVPVDDEGTRQVTCAVYPTETAERAIAEAGSGGSIQSYLDAVSFEAVAPDVWRSWDEDGRSWYSVDTPQALDRGMQLFS